MRRANFNLGKTRLYDLYFIDFELFALVIAELVHQNERVCTAELYYENTGHLLGVLNLERSLLSKRFWNKAFEGVVMPYTTPYGNHSRRYCIAPNAPNNFSINNAGPLKIVKHYLETHEGIPSFTGMRGIKEKHERLVKKPVNELEGMTFKNHLAEYPITPSEAFQGTLKDAADAINNISTIQKKQTTKEDNPLINIKSKSKYLKL